MLRKKQNVGWIRRVFSVVIHLFSSFFSRLPKRPTKKVDYDAKNASNPPYALYLKLAFMFLKQKDYFLYKIVTNDVPNA